MAIDGVFLFALMTMVASAACFVYGPWLDMATIRDGRISVLLVVDVQVGIMRGAWDASRIIGDVALVVDRARARRVPVLWVQHWDAQMPSGSEALCLVPQLKRAAEERLIAKHFNSSFEETTLEAELAALGRHPRRARGREVQRVHPRHRVRRARARL